MYTPCKHCGTRNDPGEKCDCQKSPTKAPVDEVTDLIVIRQLPIIEERLKEISVSAQEKIADALALECTNDNIQTVKKLRTDLRNDFNALEDKRKEVDRAIKEKLKPFTEAYKAFITDVYVPADAELKSRIDALEDEKKEQMRQKAKAYFDEYRQSKDIDFVSFEQAGIPVTLSVSEKKIKEQAKAFIDRIVDDLALIDSQDHKAEILVEYRRSLNISQAITTVKARIEAVKAQRRRQEAQLQQAKMKQWTIKKVEAKLAPPIQVAEPPTKAEAEQMLRLSFVVDGPMEELKALKRYIESRPLLKIIK